MKQLSRRNYSWAFLYHHEVVRSFPLEAYATLRDLRISNLNLPYLSSTYEVLCFKNLFLAYCLTLALIGFSDCCDFWKNLGTFLKEGSDYYYFLLASSIYCRNNRSVSSSISWAVRWEWVSTYFLRVPSQSIFCRDIFELSLP